MESLRTRLERSCFAPRLQARGKRAVLEELADLLVSGGVVVADRRTDVLAAWNRAYPGNPTSIDAYLPFAKMEDNWQTWYEEYDAGGLKLSDGTVVKFAAKTYDDESNKERVQELYTRLATEDNADFLISPYSSGLTAAASIVAEQNGKIIERMERLTREFERTLQIQR